MTDPRPQRELIALLKEQQRGLERFYARKAREMARALKDFQLKNPYDAWAGNRRLEKKFDRIMKGMDLEFKDMMRANLKRGLDLSHVHQDRMIEAYERAVLGKVQRNTAYMFRNANALEGWANRRASGWNISGRVWKLGSQTKEQMETFIRAGLSEGRDARTLAGDVKKYLKEPNRRFRRVRDPETGKLKLSNPAKNYHPGRGVYRSSYKNALRLTRNETNLAYRTAEYDRRQRLDFVKGIRVRLSNAHPKYDICDELQGIYPKSFQFSGWHPNCICYTTTELMSRKEFIHKLNTGKDRVKPITRIPARAERYIGANADTIKGLNNPPYWVIDNFKPTKEGLTLKKNIGKTYEAKLTYRYDDPDVLDENIAYMDRMGMDTLEAYMNDPQRTVLQNSWVEKVTRGKSTKTNTIHMTGGAPANGKSTYMKSGFAKYPKGLTTIDTDEIKKLIPEFQHMTKRRGLEAANYVHEESSMVSKKVMEKMLRDKKDFLLDGVNGGGFDKLAPKIKRMKDGGRNRIVANYVTLDNELSWKLANARAFTTSRRVLAQYVKNANTGMPGTVKDILRHNLMDEFYLWDTNINGKPRLIVSLIDGKIKYHDKALWERFLAKEKWNVPNYRE